MRVAVVVLGVAGCSFEAPRRDVGTTVDAPGAVTPSIDAAIDAPEVSTLTPRIFIEQLVTQECQQAFACQSQYPPNKQPSFAHEWGANLAECLEIDVDYRERDAIDAAIAAGRITWNATAAAACLAASGIPTSCSKLFEDSYDWSSSCYDALVGHVADGAACSTGWECGPTSQCLGGTCGHS